MKIGVNDKLTRWMTANSLESVWLYLNPDGTYYIQPALSALPAITEFGLSVLVAKNDEE